MLQNLNLNIQTDKYFHYETELIKCRATDKHDVALPVSARNYFLSLVCQLFQTWATWAT